jgi:hypothetical protein
MSLETGDSTLTIDSTHAGTTNIITDSVLRDDQNGVQRGRGFGSGRPQEVLFLLVDFQQNPYSGQQRGVVAADTSKRRSIEDGKGAATTGSGTTHVANPRSVRTTVPYGALQP